MNSAVIVAGGSGTRIGGKIPKQFLKMKGKELLSYSVSTFLKHKEIHEVIIVSHPDWFETVTANYLDCRVVVGGRYRQDSSLNGVRATDVNAENILIHDAARPFISPAIISDCLMALKISDGSAPVMISSNSLIQLDNDRASYIDRSKIREVQTPQCFKKKFILKVLESDLVGTDEIGMVLKKFPRVQLEFVKGEKINYKLTTEMDFQMALQILDTQSI